MQKTAKIALLVTLCVALSGCGRLRESRLNPFNWFGRSVERTAPVTADGSAAPTDNRILVSQVTALQVDQMPGGAVIAATGLPPTQGWWDAELVPENDGEPVEGVMTYRFVVAEPPFRNREGVPQSREVTAGAFLSDIKLEAISEIVVLGESNSRVSRR
jgi:hypothetical protein